MKKEIVVKETFCDECPKGEVEANYVCAVCAEDLCGKHASMVCCYQVMLCLACNKEYSEIITLLKAHSPSHYIQPWLPYSYEHPWWLPYGTTPFITCKNDTAANSITYNP